MLEIFDENGETTLSVNDGTTRIVAIYQRAVHGDKIPPPQSNLRQMFENEPNIRPFMVVNNFFEISNEWIPPERLLAPAEHLIANDIAILGVYYV